MKFKKMIAGIAAIAVISSLAGCTQPKPKPSEETEKTEASSEETTTEATTTAETTTEATSESTTVPTETSIVEVENTFKFTEQNFPKLDGSTSTKPMGAAIKSLLVGIDKEAAENSLVFHKTSKSFEYLINGDADVLVVAQPSDEVFEMMDNEGFEYEMEPFALEALVFVVNEGNPVDSLTSQQVVDIYTGKITNWKEVGGPDLRIDAVQRNHSSGSQVMMDKLVMKGEEMMEAETEMMPADMGELIEVVKGFDNSMSAIGYTPYYYATSMGMASGLKILKINDVEPNSDTIKAGDYPYINPYYVVRAKNTEDIPTIKLYDWILGPDGQKLTELEGYVPAK